MFNRLEFNTTNYFYNALKLGGLLLFSLMRKVNKPRKLSGQEKNKLEGILL